MAKHAAHTEDNQSTEILGGYSGGYTYPDGSTYGAPAGSQAAKEKAQAAPYSRNNVANYTTLSSVYTQRLQKKRRNKRIAAAVTALTCLLLLAGVGIFFYLHQADSNLGYSDSSYAQEVLAKLANQEEEHLFYTLIIGADYSEDRYGESTSSARSDVLILARVDTDKKTVTLVSIPRDTPWQQESGEYYKINRAYNMGGAALAVDAVEQVSGIRANHIAEINLDQLEDFIDRIGGLDFDVPVNTHDYVKETGEEYYIEAGQQHLSGEEALAVVRMRKGYEGDQDAGRQSTIRGIVAALYNQVVSRPKNELPTTVLDAAECVDTDIKTVQLFRILTSLGADAKFYNVSAPSAGDVDPVTQTWLCYKNPEGWARLMEMVKSGEDPSSISYADDAVYYPSTNEQVVVQ